MNVAQFRAFHAIAEEGGFTALASRLGLTQPAVTLQAKALEGRDQVELFHRRSATTFWRVKSTHYEPANPVLTTAMAKALRHSYLLPGECRPDPTIVIM